MKEISINKTYNIKGNNILINAKYLVEDNIDLTNEIMLLDRNMNTLSYNDKERIIEIIKTIFSNYNEKYLQVLFRNEKIDFGVKYKKGKIVKYYNSYDIDKYNKLIFDYSYIYGIKTNIINNKHNIFECDPMIYSNKVKDGLNRLFYFNNVRVEKLTRDDLYIVKLYETLYNKKIDFDRENIKEELTSIMFLLEEASINLPEDIYFYKDSNRICSFGLDKIISRLMLFEDIDVSNIKLSNDDIELINSLSILLKENNIDIKLLASDIYDNKYRNINKDNLDIRDKIKKLTK